MRHIHQTIVIATMLCALCVTALGQSTATKPEAHFDPVFFNADGRQVSPPSSLAANQMSGNGTGSVLSLLFDSARVSLQSESDPLVATWVGTVTVPTNPSAKPKLKSYLQHLRGSVTKSADTRVTISLELGGKHFVIEFPYGMKHEGDITRAFVSLVPRGSTAPYTASIVIFAERRNAKGALLVDVDALDVDAR